METGVRGEAGLRVQRRMLEEQVHDIKNIFNGVFRASHLLVLTVSLLHPY